MNATTPQAPMLALIEQWAAAELAGDAEAASVLLTDDWSAAESDSDAPAELSVAKPVAPRTGRRE